MKLVSMRKFEEDIKEYGEFERKNWRIYYDAYVKATERGLLKDYFDFDRIFVGFFSKEDYEYEPLMIWFNTLKTLVAEELKSHGLEPERCLRINPKFPVDETYLG